jgi:hypothetical protein
MANTTTNTGYPREPATDKGGRILDPNTGRPLRDRGNRPYGKAPYKGKPGKLNVKAAVQLTRRQKAFDESKLPAGYHRPGSLKKS